MKTSEAIFIADTCIGGLSVVKAMWSSGSAYEAVFMADYAVNPLGVKDDSAIADVVKRWLRLAEEHSDTLLIACNTLSIRYHRLLRSRVPVSTLSHIISMVDCFEALVKMESDRLANRKVLIIGTEFTAGQKLYPDILSAALPGIRVSTVAATDLERKIARFQLEDNGEEPIFTSQLRQAIENTDVAVLACTCFPMVRAELESTFPGVDFLDPGEYCPGLMKAAGKAQKKELSIKVSGDVVSKKCVLEFARSYLPELDHESSRLLVD